MSTKIRLPVNTAVGTNTALSGQNGTSWEIPEIKSHRSKVISNSYSKTFIHFREKYTACSCKQKQTMLDYFRFFTTEILLYSSVRFTLDKQD